VTPRRAVGARAAATVTTLLLTGCGDDGVDDGAALRAEGGGADQTIEARDIEFDRDAYRIAAGLVDIAYTHEGALPHSLVIDAADGRDIDGLKLEGRRHRCGQRHGRPDAGRLRRPLGRGGPQRGRHGGRASGRVRRHLRHRRLVRRNQALPGSGPAAPVLWRQRGDGDLAR